MLRAAFLSLLSDSNQRPRDYKSRAWPTELKRRVGELTASHSFDLLPLLRSRSGGFTGEHVVQHSPDDKITLLFGDVAKFSENFKYYLLNPQFRVDGCLSAMRAVCMRLSVFY